MIGTDTKITPHYQTLTSQSHPASISELQDFCRARQQLCERSEITTGYSDR